MLSPQLPDRLNASSLSQDLQDRMILNEVGTLGYLTFARVPVLKVYGFALHNQGKDVGVGYIPMDRLQGHPLDLNSADAAQKRRFF